MAKLSIPPDSKKINAFIFGEWDLYLRPFQGSNPSLLWLPFKLMLDPDQHEQKWGRQRSHYLTWGVDVQRLRRDGAAARLHVENRELYEAFEHFCVQHYGQDWLTEQMTEDELKAERERLATQAARVQSGPGRGFRRKPAVDPFS